MLRNISCMVVLSSALGAIFSNDVELKATLLPLFTGTKDSKALRSGGSHCSTVVPGLLQTLQRQGLLISKSPLEIVHISQRRLLRLRKVSSDSLLAHGLYQLSMRPLKDHT